MKAFTIDRYKSKDGGRIVDLAQPEVGDNDVLVQIHAAGVNLLDAKIAAGEFKLFLPYRFPLVLGNDVAGVVVQVGSRVRRFKPGDEVYARPDKDRIGTFAEFISMAEDDVAIKPRELTMAEAASIPPCGPDRLASTGRDSRPEARAEGLHPGGHRRRRHVRDTAG
jgi:NADPH:quinone reductase-like Zn-dependent oxidoreductase